MFRVLILAAATLSLGACAGVIPQREPANALYRLSPMDPAYPLSASVTVREPEASRLLSGRFMSAEDETGAIRFVRSIQWTDRLTSLLWRSSLFVQFVQYERHSKRPAGLAVPLRRSHLGSSF